MNTNLSSKDLNIWSVDPIHSQLSFKTKHLMISVMTGYVKSFDLEVQTSGNDFGEVTDLTLVADISSLTTHYEPRDEHLKSQDFFDVINHPYIKFQKTLFEKQGMTPPSLLSAYRRDFKLQGMLSIKGVSRLIILDGLFGGISTDINGQKRAGFTTKGKISRREFGLTWAGVTPAGKLIVADEVEIEGNIQLIKKSNLSI